MSVLNPLCTVDGKKSQSLVKNQALVFIFF